MYVAEVSFNLATTDLDEEANNEIENIIYSLLAAWRNNGQILESDWSIVRVADKCLVQIVIPENHSLNSSNDHKPVTAALEKLKLLGFISLETKIIGKIFDLKESCSCTTRNSFILYWPFLSRGSPLRCGNCFLSVPLYQIPPTDNDCYQDILFWQAEYEACDTLNILSSVLEKASVREISRFDSNLSKKGRGVCQTIENLAGKPTYYYLDRDNGRSRNKELARKCPECGGEWLLVESWHNRFDFRCEKSKLVSNIAWDVR